MQRTASALVGLALIAAAAAWSSAASPVQVGPSSNRNYLDAVNECRAAAQSGRALTDAELDACNHVGESINKSGTVVIDSFRSERFLVREMMQRDYPQAFKGNASFTCDGSVQSLQQALYRTGNQSEDNNVANELARTYVAGAQIVSDNRFGYASLGSAVAGLYQYNACVQDAKTDPDRGIFMSSELRDQVCRNCNYGGSRLCGATYTHEAAHHLGRLTHEVGDDKIEIETYAFYRECLYATEAFGGKAATSDAMFNGVREWNVVFHNMETSGSEVVKLYGEHIRDIMMTWNGHDCDKAQLRQMVEKLYRNLPSQQCKPKSPTQPS